MPARGGGPGGKRGGSRGGRGSKPQRGCRSVPTEEEVMARNRMGDPPDNSEQSEEEEQEDEEQQQQAELQKSKPPKSFPESDDEEMLIGAGNPNRNPNLSEAQGPSRREREALEHAKHQALMQKLEAEGKTSKAKADLARLAEIRKQRERAKASTSPPTR